MPHPRSIDTERTIAALFDVPPYVAFGPPHPRPPQQPTWRHPLTASWSWLADHLIPSSALSGWH